MSWNHVVPKRIAATTIALAFALFLLGTHAAAQVTVQPRVELFGGYSWLHPNGYVDWGKVPDIAHGWNANAVFYLPQAHNLGLVIDGSGHYNGSYANVGIGDLGLQLKWHNDQFSPFVQVLAGTTHISPAGLPAQWRPMIGGGGGFDLQLGNFIAIRLVQADYLWTYYNPVNLTTRSHNWNMIRLSSGIVFNLGTYYNPPISCTASAMPAEVWSGDPVKVTTTGTNFNPKHTLTYAWEANGGKLSDASMPTATVDTTGMAPGSFSARSTITDPKLKNMDSGVHSRFLGQPDPIKPATCAAAFTVKQPQPPVVSCSANPTTIAVGEPSTITMTASDPQGWPLTYSWSATGGQLNPNGTTATLTATSADAGTTITVTGTATDARANLSASCTASVNSPQVTKCTNIEDWGECTFEKNPKKPWRVDNDCKDTLDKLSLRLQQMPNGKLDIVGYTDEKEVVKEQTLGAQRSVNVKYYLTTDGPTKIDAGRIQPREGGAKGKATHFYFVPEGNLCGGQLEEGTVVDETQVQPQSRNAPPKKAHHKAKPAAPPAQ